MPIAPPCNTRNEETTDSWISPIWIRDTFGPFDLDPCACIPQPWPMAEHQYTEDDDGLLMPWKGLAYVNPPYGKALDAWLNRCALHGNAIALVFARTETKAFFKNVWPKATVLMFLKGRLTFHLPDGTKSRTGGNSGGPSVLIAYGETAAERLEKHPECGAVVRLKARGNP